MTVKSLNFRGHTQPALSQSLPSRNREPRATVMGSSDSKPEEPPEVLQPASAEAGGQDCGPKLGKSGKKICCSCPDTKVIRDDCVIMNGEDECAEAIEAHKACLRSEGFDIR